MVQTMRWSLAGTACGPSLSEPEGIAAGGAADCVQRDPPGGMEYHRAPTMIAGLCRVPSVVR